MKNTTMKLAIAAAFLAVATGVASAQAMKADIPFAFRAGDAVMAPGTYLVEVKDASHKLYLFNRESRQSAILVAAGASDAAKEWRANGEPVMAFECGAARCALTQVWAGPERLSLTLPYHPLGRGEQPVLTLIRLARSAR